MFKSRIFKSENELPEIAKSAVHLFYSNDEVDAYNQSRMLFLGNKVPPPRKITCLASDKVSGIRGRPDRVLQQTNQILSSVQTLKSKDTQGLVYTLPLQIGVRYMITVNINVADGIFNGASGVLEDFTESNGTCNIAWIKFDDEKIGNKIYYFF